MKLILASLILVCLEIRRTSSAVARRLRNDDVYSNNVQPFDYTTSLYRITYPKSYDYYNTGVSSVMPLLNSDVMHQELTDIPQWSTGSLYDYVHMLMKMRPPMMLTIKNGTLDDTKIDRPTMYQKKISRQGPESSSLSDQSKAQLLRSVPAERYAGTSQAMEPQAKTRQLTKMSEWSNPNGKTHKGRKTVSTKPINRSASI